MKKNFRKQNSNAKRPLRLESLESREMLDAVPLTAAEYADLRAQYADFDLAENMDDMNVITLDLAEGDGLTELKAAITEAGTTTESDLIVVRTSDKASSITFTSNTDTISIAINASKYGSISIIGLGNTQFCISAYDLCSVMTVSSHSQVNIGNLNIGRGKAQYGGGINNSGFLSIKDTQIVNSKAYQQGGGIYNSGTLNIHSSTINGNEAVYLGGGVYNIGKATICRTQISGNSIGTLDSGGGGIYSTNALTVQNSLIVLNGESHGWGTGGGVYISGKASIINCTINYNTSNITIYADSNSNLSIYNSILLGTVSNYGKIYGYYNISTFTKWTDGSNNISDISSSLFGEGYQILKSSQAYNAGSNEYAAQFGVTEYTTDYAGKPRILNERIDIGAYELAVADNLKKDTKYTDSVSGSKIYTFTLSEKTQVSLGKKKNWGAFDVRLICTGQYETLTEEPETITLNAGTYYLQLTPKETETKQNYSFCITKTPTAINDVITASKSDFFLIDVCNNDIVPDEKEFSIISVTQPQHGRVIPGTDGRIAYYAKEKMYNDVFTYTIEDEFGGQSTATVTITAPENEVPVAQADTIQADRNGQALIDILANDTDPDGDALAVSITTEPEHGYAEVLTSGKVRYTSTDGTFPDSFTYTISDGFGGTSTATVTITVPANESPVAQTDTIQANRNGQTLIDVLANDTDPDGDALTVSITTEPEHGYAEVLANGKVRYTSTDGTFPDSFTYTISDGFGGTSTTTVTITAPENEKPVAVNDSARVELNGHVLIDVLANDSDPDGDVVSILSVNQPTNGSVVLTKDDKILYLPKTGFSGDDSFTYTVSDGHGGTAEATVSVKVIRTFKPLIVTESGESPEKISEWEVFNVDLRNVEGLTETQTVCLAWDAALFELNVAEAASEKGVSVELGEAVTENGITTQDVILNVENPSALNENDLLASFGFLPVVTDSVKAGDSSDWTINVNREALNVAVESFVYDLDDSGSVEIEDLVAFSRVFSQNSTDSETARIADFDGNGTVAINDLVLFAKNFNSLRPDKLTVPTQTIVSSTTKLEELPATPCGNVNDAAMAAYWDETK